MTTYDLLKDFAAPIATIIASFTAAGVATVFAVRQSRLAERQAEIAFSKLKHDTFDDRQKIYKAASHILYLSAHNWPLNEEDRASYYENLALVYEGKFHFRQKTVEYITKVAEKSHRMVRITFRQRHLIPDSQKWHANEDEIDKLGEWLDKQLAELPVVFGDEMSLSLPETQKGSPIIPGWAAIILIAMVGAILLVLLGILGAI